MRKKLHPSALLLIICISIFCGCKKDPGTGGGGNGGGGNGGSTTPRIDSYNPSYLWNGTPVTLTGVNFGTSINNVYIKIGGWTISPTAVTATTITFNVPSMVSYGADNVALYIIVNNTNSNTLNVTVYAYPPQPRGWFYVNKEMSGPGIPREMYFYDNAYRFGFAYGNGMLSSTSDDGASWGGVWPGTHWGNGFNVYDEDEAWIETNWKDVWVYDFQWIGSNSSYARLDTITTIPALRDKVITGTYITSRKHGYLLTHEGSVFKVNGSFAPADISLEYQPTTYTTLPIGYSNNNYYALNGYDANNFIIAGRPTINGQIGSMIIMKRNGVYHEYFFDASQYGYPYRVYYADPNNIYFVSLSYDLFKYNVATDTWVRPTTIKFNEICFINGTTGYACQAWTPGVNYFNIYKTTDGGSTWTVDYSLDRDYLGYTMCHKGNKVWVIGEEINFHKNFVLKYNP